MATPQEQHRMRELCGGWPSLRGLPGCEQCTPDQRKYCTSGAKGGDRRRELRRAKPTKAVKVTKEFERLMDEKRMLAKKHSKKPSLVEATYRQWAPRLADLNDGLPG